MLNESDEKQADRPCLVCLCAVCGRTAVAAEPVNGGTTWTCDECGSRTMIRLVPVHGRTDPEWLDLVAQGKIHFPLVVEGLHVRRTQIGHTDTERLDLLAQRTIHIPVLWDDKWYVSLPEWDIPGYSYKTKQFGDLREALDCALEQCEKLEQAKEKGGRDAESKGEPREGGF